MVFWVCKGSSTPQIVVVQKWSLCSFVDKKVHSIQILSGCSKMWLFVDFESNLKIHFISLKFPKNRFFYKKICKNLLKTNGMTFKASAIFFILGLVWSMLIVISISRNGLLKSCARFVIERSEIRKKQHDFKSVHFECRMVLFYMIWEKSRL